MSARILWHPEQHEPLEWIGRPCTATRSAPFTTHRKPGAMVAAKTSYIRFEALEDVPPEIRDVIVYEHVMIVAGLGHDETSLTHPDPMGYRIHQWEQSDSGVIGRSSAIGTRKKETAAEGDVWAAHAGVEIANWAVFLPNLYELYRAVTDTRRNPYADLSVDGRAATPGTASSLLGSLRKPGLSQRQSSIETLRCNCSFHAWTVEDRSLPTTTTRIPPGGYAGTTSSSGRVR